MSLLAHPLPKAVEVPGLSYYSVPTAEIGKIDAPRLSIPALDALEQHFGYYAQR